MDSAFLILKGGIPGSLGFLLLGLTVGVILLLVRPTCRRWGHAWLIALIAFYWALFLPAFALWLQAGLVGDLGQVSRRDVRDVDTIVALSAGGYTVREGARALHVLTYHSALTVLETARVFHLLDDATILVSGGISAPDRLGPESASMRDGLVVVDIPMTRIRVESKSRNTFEQAVEVSRLLRADRRDRFVLVTRPAHMWRSMILFGPDPLSWTPNPYGRRSLRCPKPGSPIRRSFASSWSR